MNIKEKLPIDWHDTLKFSGNDPVFAKQFLALLIESWEADVPLIETALRENNTIEVKRLIHRVRGAISYSCLPLLKEQLFVIDQAIRNNASPEDIQPLIEQMKREMKDVEEAFQRI